jgi:hypothetical protein
MLRPFECAPSSAGRKCGSQFSTGLDRCPRLGALRQTRETIGTLRGLERDGQLAIAGPAGGVVIGVAEPDEPGPALR